MKIFSLLILLTFSLNSFSTSFTCKDFKGTSLESSANIVKMDIRAHQLHTIFQKILNLLKQIGLEQTVLRKILL